MILKKQPRLILLILVVGISTAITIFLITKNRIKLQLEKDFSHQADTETIQLKANLDLNEGILLGIRSLYKASDFVDRNEFKIYTTLLLEKYPFIQSLHWLPFVPHFLRLEYEKRAQKEYPQFQFKEKTPQGDLVPAKERSEYFPVYYSESRTTVVSPLGFDIASEKPFLFAIEKARKSGQVKASSRVSFGEKEGDHVGIFIFAPLFYYENKASPPIVKEIKKEKIEGFVMGAYNLNNMIDKITAHLANKNISLLVYDVTEETNKTILYGSPSNDYRLKTRTSLTVFGREWILLWHQKSTPHSFFTQIYPWLLLGFIFLVTLSIAIIFSLMSSRTESIQKKVTERTEELTKSNQLLREEIEKRQKTEDALVTAKNLAEEASQAKSLFLANMSHELRTPLNAIIGYSEILIEEGDIIPQEETVSSLKVIQRSGQDLLQIIIDLLEVAKIESGKALTVCLDYSLDHIIKELEASVRPLAMKNNNKLIVSSALKTETIRTDIIKLRQILFNLLSNACKFCQEGKITLIVENQSQDSVEGVFFSVSDTGIGIDSDDRKKLFQLFSQVDSSLAREYEGMGVGLFISQKYCQMLRGEITVDSKLKEGSSFSFWLPLSLE